MFSILKKNISKSTILIVLAIAGVLMLINALIKAAFILSNESAVQKAEVSDIVLGTISLGWVLVALLAINLVVYLIFVKKHDFTNKLVFVLLGAAMTLIVAAIMVIVKDHASYIGDWAKLNDIEKARNDIAANLSVANTLASDVHGNTTEVKNTLLGSEYEAFVNQVIQSKKDLAALYPVDELLNKFNEPLIASKIADGLAVAYQADHTITAASYFASPAWIEDAKNIKITFTKNADVFKAIRALMSQPVVYTGLTTAYLQSGMPLDITVISVASTALLGGAGLSLVKGVK